MFDPSLAADLAASPDSTLGGHSHAEIAKPKAVRLQAPTLRTLTKASTVIKYREMHLRTSSIWFVTSALVFAACCFMMVHLHAQIVSRALIYSFMAVWGASALAWPLFAVLMLKAALLKLLNVR